jgi:hypothetical protein
MSGWTLIENDGRKRFVENERLAVYLASRPDTVVHHDVKDFEIGDPIEPRPLGGKPSFIFTILAAGFGLTLAAVLSVGGWVGSLFRRNT